MWKPLLSVGWGAHSPDGSADSTPSIFGLWNKFRLIKRTKNWKSQKVCLFFLTEASKSLRIQFFCYCTPPLLTELLCFLRHAWLLLHLGAITADMLVSLSPWRHEFRLLLNELLTLQVFICAVKVAVLIDCVCFSFYQDVFFFFVAPKSCQY